MGADPRLANLPALRKLAEEEARTHHDAWEAAVRLAGGTRFLIEETIATRAMLGSEEETAAHLALLSDFTRPASRDAAARLVAERIEVSPGWLISAIDNDDSLSLEKWRWACEYAHMPVAGATPTERATLLTLHVLGSPDAHR